MFTNKNSSFFSKKTQLVGHLISKAQGRPFVGIGGTLEIKTVNV